MADIPWFIGYVGIAAVVGAFSWRLGMRIADDYRRRRGISDEEEAMK